jgi:hypothetical protein
MTESKSPDEDIRGYIIHVGTDQAVAADVPIRRFEAPRTKAETESPDGDIRGYNNVGTDRGVAADVPIRRFE